jgi:paraquat-inducible protein A
VVGAGIAMSTIAMTGMKHGLQRCEGCTLLSRPAHGEEEGRCPRCGAHLEYRKASSVQRTWALLIAAAFATSPRTCFPC